MACFWKNERNAVEVCLSEVGNYVYIGYEAPDPYDSLIEVARDLSGYAKIALPDGLPGNGAMYSKRRYVYSPHYDTVPNPNTVTISRHDGAGVFSEISGIPTGLAANAKEVIYAAGKLRAINEDAGFVDSLYESDDGETWAMAPGSVSFPRASGGYPAYYTVLGGRLISMRYGAATSSVYALNYSDDGGATWSAGTGSNVSGLGNTPYPFVHSGPNIIAVHGGNIFIGTSGAAWTLYAGLYNDVFTVPKGPRIAASGAGLVVAAGVEASSSDYAFAYSSNHGGSWATRTQVAGGLPDLSNVKALFYDPVSVEFVAFVKRGDTDDFQIYTSPTGQNWTAGIVIPQTSLNSVNVVQVID